MVEGVNSSMIYLICCKNFYKSQNVLLSSTKIKINKLVNKSINLQKTHNIHRICMATAYYLE
jgi:hypothetical protein